MAAAFDWAARTRPLKPRGRLGRFPPRGWALVIVGAGWLILLARSWLGALGPGWLAWLGALSWLAAIAAAALWLVVVLLILAVWDLAAALWDWVRPLAPFAPMPLPRWLGWLRPWLSLIFLVAGLLFGHWVWN